MNSTNVSTLHETFTMKSCRDHIDFVSRIAKKKTIKDGLYLTIWFFKTFENQY